MGGKQRSGTNAPFVRLHQQAFRRFEELAQEERKECLIEIGILNKNGELSRRYGGGTSRKGNSREKRAAKAAG